MKKYYCIDCKKLKSKTGLRCKKCAYKISSQKISGKNHYNWKGGLPNCIDCEKPVSARHVKRCFKCHRKTQIGKGNYNYGNHKLKGQKNPMYGKPCSFNRKKKIRLALKGKYIGSKNPNWRGGIGREPYTYDFYKIRSEIRKRDKYICQLCLEFGDVVHHIDYNKRNNQKENLITLCRICNSRVNGNRNYWTDYFQKQVKVGL